MKVSLLSHGDYVCGISRYTDYIAEALNMVGIEAELVTPETIGNPDIILLTNIGLSNEVSNKAKTEASKRRLEALDKYYGKVPFAVVRHSISDLPFFKLSYEYFKDKVFDLVVMVERGEDMKTHISQTLYYKHCVYLALPFKFDDKNFSDKSVYDRNIICPSRIGSVKKTNVVLEIAEKLYGKKEFFVTGKEVGTYWYFQLREHPSKQFVKIVGEYTDFRDIYRDVAFGIDLTYPQRGGLVTRDKIQYTGIEMVDCGVIPIGFDAWKSTENDGYDGVWLPDPEKIGRKMVFDVKKYAEIIESHEYNFKTAKRNREILKKRCDLQTIGKDYKYWFEKIL